MTELKSNTFILQFNFAQQDLRLFTEEETGGVITADVLQVSDLAFIISDSFVVAFRVTKSALIYINQKQ